MNPKFVLPKIGELPITASIESICKFEKVPTRICTTENEGAVAAADIVVNAIKAHKGNEPFVLGLSTGRTPLGLYAELVRRYNAGEISFANVKVYSLDEFYPMEPSSPQSRNHRVYEDFLEYVDIDSANVHFPDGTVARESVNDYCKKYEQMVNGKVDLMIMGVGELGQIGFNEPGSYAHSTTRLVQLSYNTRKNQDKFFSNPNEVPKMAITMGLETIMSAKKLVLMMWGEDKARVAYGLIEGDVCEEYPATFLQNHDDIEVVIDEAAAQELTRVKEPWLIAPPQEWSDKLVRKAVIWLCQVVGKPILKLTHQDYIKNSLSDLLERVGTYDKINIRVRRLRELPRLTLRQSLREFLTEMQDLSASMTAPLQRVIPLPLILKAASTAFPSTAARARTTSLSSVRAALSPALRSRSLERSSVKSLTLT